jgi:uncharacterized protein
MAQIITHGSGEVRRIGDRARVSVVFTGRARERAAAVDALAARVAPVEAALTGAGVTVESRRLSVHDAFDGKRRSGTAADQHYSVLVTDPERLSDVIAELLVADPSALHGPSWHLGDRSGAFGEARRIAVADARAAAQGYADALAAELGPLVRLEDMSGRGAQATSLAMRHRAGAPAVAELSLVPEEVTVSATCSTTWELL